MLNIILTWPVTVVKLKVGGVATYLKDFLQSLDCDRFYVFNRDKYLTKSLPIRKTSAIDIFFIRLSVIFYFFTFCYRLLFKKVDIVHANPSLLINAVVRDAFYIAIASVFRKRIVVFFHGWNLDFAKFIDTRPLIRKLFVRIYNKADTICVLAEEFKQQLESWGIKSTIHIETTMVNNNLLSSFNFESSFQKRLSEPFNILFLSRIEKEKGIYEAIEAVSILRNRHINACLIVAGNGSQVDEMKNYIIQNKKSGIKFIGYVEGEKKKKAFDSSYAFILPSYGEGMPISVLEAMSFGLPVLTRSVGGLKDFFINGKHGFITNSIDPEIFADNIEKIINTPQLYKHICYHNYRFAQDQLMASEVTRRIESIYLKLAGEN